MKQGGILSPVLFCVYIDSLLSNLQGKGIGCYLGNHYAGALAYADDICLLSPSVVALQKMLDICVRYCHNHKIELNCQKSFVSVFSSCPEATIPSLYVNRPSSNGEANQVELPFVRDPVHLGHRLKANMRQEVDIDHQYMEFNRKANAILNTFSGCDPFCRVSLLNNFAGAFYGSQLWDLSKIEPIKVAYRKAQRKALCIPWRSHSKLIPIITGRLPIEEQLANRFMKFFDLCASSSDPLLSYIAESATANPWSSFGNNFKKVKYQKFLDNCRALSEEDENIELYGAIIKDLLSMNGWRDVVDVLCVL